MRKVLIIANQFPPMGGSGVQRSVKFVKHLGKFGYEPVVFTRNADNAALKDETLLKDIPQGTEIIRTSAFEFTEWRSAFKLLGKVLGLKVLIPDSARVWFEMSKKKAIEVIKRENIKLIYTTSAPYSDHLLGLYIKKKMPDITWIADFRDEWTNNPYILDKPYNFIRTRIEKNMEYKVLTSADALITNTPVMRRNFIVNNNLREDNFYFIPNGYDEEDFLGLQTEKTKNDRFTMTYTGALYGRRKPDNFFEALKRLKEKGLIDGERVLVKLIGNYHRDKLQAQIDSYGLTKQFEIVGYVPHDVCIREQLKSDALVLIEGSGRGADAFYTGKIFEYMNTNRPVLAFLPNGVAKDLVEKTKIGIVSDVDNVDKMEDSILEYYNKWLEGSLSFDADMEEIKRYERKELTRQLAKVFDKYYK